MIETLPALARLHGSTVVVPVAAAVLAEEAARRALAEDLTVLRLVGVRPVVVTDPGRAADSRIDLVRLLGGSGGGAVGLTGAVNVTGVQSLVDAAVVPVLLGAERSAARALAAGLRPPVRVRRVAAGEPHALLTGLLG
ncbi:hypothetical protein ABZW30_31630 [Kitasatospora sp. NPDC004669]|uniref:hypothetical protein n=1 Tax=Kitasatospora sp. NPDC004669 TaxID=3154555 RepID=UPI0033AE1442